MFLRRPLKLIVFELISGQSEVSVDALMQRMRSLSQKQDECSETELNDRFKTVEMQVNLNSSIYI